MDWLPLQIDVRKKPCLIMGGGEVAARKYELLLRAGATITIIAPNLNLHLQERLAYGEFSYYKGTFAEHRQLLSNFFLIIAATNQPNINHEISVYAKQHELLVNVVDNGLASSVIFPAIIDRFPIVVAIGSNGYSPLLVRAIKARIEIQLPANIGIFGEVLRDLNEKINSVFPSRYQRHLFIEKIIEHFFSTHTLSNSYTKVHLALENFLTAWKQTITQPAGRVYIIGAGPGDPELLTLKAYRIIQNCDVVLYDHLVAPAILEYVRRDAKKILVGRRCGDHHCRQADIHQQLLHYAQAGLQVVRLKGGDPALFSRFGEEAEFLSQHHIIYEVIPGITAALGCAASLKIPLTHRAFASGCSFITAHTCEEKMPINWVALAKSNNTLVFYMGVKSVPKISNQLIAAGLAPNTPMAVVIDGTRAEEKVWLDTVVGMPQKIASQTLSGPGLIVIGEVLQLYSRHINNLHNESLIT